MAALPPPSASLTVTSGRRGGRDLRERLALGAGGYVDDVHLDGLLHARIVRSLLPAGALLDVDPTAAKAVDGVYGVFTAADLGPVGERRIPLRFPPTDPRLAEALQPPLARDRVRYVGEPVAIVVASDPYVAEDAAELVLVELDDALPVVDPFDALTAEPLHPTAGGNTVGVLEVEYGESIEQALADAEVRVRERFRVHRHMSAPLETRGLVATPDADGVVVWGAAKVKHVNRDVLAGFLDLDPSTVRLLETDVGGSFGARGEFYPEDVLVPWCALRLGRSVKWVEDRAEHFVATNHSRELVFDVELGASRDGALRACRVDAVCNLGAYARPVGEVLPRLALTMFAGPYRWPAFAGRMTSVTTNKTPSGSFRGPGATEACFARERALDVLAANLAVDPVDLRRRNLIRADELPLDVSLGAQGGTLEHRDSDYPALFEAALETADHAAACTERDRRRRAGEHVGVGVAAYLEGTAFGPFEEATVVARPEGDFECLVGVSSYGQGIDATLISLAADALGVDEERVVVNFHDTAAVPSGFGSWASRSAVVAGNALVLAVADLHRNAARRLAHSVGGVPDDIAVANGRAWHPNAPESARSLGELAAVGTARFEKTSSTLSCGTAVALVSVDRETGAVDVERFTVAYDVGRALDPPTVRHQLLGAAAQGISGATLEHLRYTEDGQPISVNLLDYKLATATEMPGRLDVLVVENAADNPLGAKGAGEGGIIGTLAAVGNAVADALGDAGLVTELPLTPERVLELLDRTFGPQTSA